MSSLGLIGWLGPRMGELYNTRMGEWLSKTGWSAIFNDNYRILTGSNSETWVWDVRTKHISCEPIPTVDKVRGLANYGQGATLFTLGPDHTIQQYDVSHSTIVKSAQYLPVLAPPVPLKVIQQKTANLSINGTQPHKSLSHGSDSSRGPRNLPSSQRIVKDALSDENVRRKMAEISSPMSTSSRNRSKFSSSHSTNLQHERRTRSPSSYAASGTTFSAISHSMGGRDSIFSGDSSLFPRTQTASSIASSGRRYGTSRLRQEIHRSPDVNAHVDLFPRTRARVNSLKYNESQALNQEDLSPGDLRKQMLDVVFGWEQDIEALIRDEIAHHDAGSPSAVLLSKWLGDVDPDLMAVAMSSGTNSSLDWMLLALSSIGGSQGAMGKLGQRFVQKLLQQGDYHTSATILLSLGEEEEALDVYISRRFYMEAILLTCLIFPENWQRQAQLVRRWGEFVMENSQQQLAIRCFTCTGMNLPPWAASSTSRNESSLSHKSLGQTASSQTPNLPQILSPPTSPPPTVIKPAGSVRMTAKNSSLKVITTFAPPNEAKFKFPGLLSDDCTPTNFHGVTPIAESAISPGGTPGGPLRMNLRNRDVMRTRTPLEAQNRLPPIGETSVDVSIPIFPRPSNLPTPDNSGSEFERTSKSESQTVGESIIQVTTPEPPLLLSSARYDPGSAVTTKSSSTAVPKTAFPLAGFPDPSNEMFSHFAEKTRARNGSRDRKPDGLQIQMPPPNINDANSQSSRDVGSGSDHKKRGKSFSVQSTGSLSGRFDPKTPSISGQSWTSAKSPASASRSIDQYISSIDEAARRRKGTSRYRQGSREGRSQNGEYKSRSKHRGHERSEDRGRNRQYIQPAKRSPRSPIPMSPDDIHLYLANPSTESLDAQLSGPPSVDLESRHGRYKRTQSRSVSNVRSGSKVSGHSARTVVRRRSPEGFHESGYRSVTSLTSQSSRQLSPDGGWSNQRGRSTSNDYDSPRRSPSSPLPMSPPPKGQPRSEDEDDPLRFVDANRQRIRSRQRKRRERGTSSRRDRSPDRRVAQDVIMGTSRTASRSEGGLQGNQIERIAPYNEGRQENENVRVASRHEGQQQDMLGLRTISRNENSRTASRNEGMQPPPQSAIEPPSARQLDEAFERQGRISDCDTNLKKKLAAQELEARRESLARRPQAPPIPHPADLSNVTSVRPPLGIRSQTIPSDSPTLSQHSSATFSDSPNQRISPQRKDFNGAPGHRAGAASMGGQYGLPATPRAMRHPNHHPNHHSASHQAEAMPALPEFPQSIEHLHQAMFHTGHPMHELPRSMSAPMPEQSLMMPVDLPQHPAFHKGLRTGNPSKRSEISFQNSTRPTYRRRPSTDSTPMAAAATAPVPFYLDESLQATDSTVQIVTIEQPPLLPELQHLLLSSPQPQPQTQTQTQSPPPPPPPPPPFSSDGAHSSTSGSGLGVINIAIDDSSTSTSPPSNQNTDHHVIDVPLTSPNERPTPVTAVVSRSNSTGGKRGRSEAAMGFKNSVKAVTDRLRSTSRGRTNRSAQGQYGEMKAPSPYESVPVNYF